MVSSGLAVAFEVTGDNCPLGVATSETGTNVTCRPPPQLRYDGNILLRAQTQADGELLARQLEDDNRISQVFVSDNNGQQLIRCLSSEACVLHTLTDAGFLPVTIRYTDGVGRFSGEVVGRDILRSVLEVARDVVGVSVRNISHIETNDSTHPAVHDVEWNLTPAQQEALQTAYLAGYLNVPRDVTAEAVADELDISKSAFLQRLRRAQYNYFRQIFDAGSADTEPN